MPTPSVDFVATLLTTRKSFIALALVQIFHIAIDDLKQKQFVW
jgi:hypothetical protein